MRRFAVVGLVTCIAFAVALPAGADLGAGALSRREAFWYQRHLDMVDRAARVSVEPPGPAGLRAPVASVEDVQQISRWTVDAGGQDDTETEPDIAVDPADPNHITGTFQQGRFSDGGGGAAAIGWATSHDGGATWTRGTLSGITEAASGPYDRATDPAVAFGPDGEVYIHCLFFNVSNDPNGFAVSRSDDGGLTWNPPVFLVSDGPGIFNDKGWIAVDTFPGSPFLGRVYVSFTRNGLQLKYSDDRGQTWSTFKSVAGSGTGTIPVVQPDGRLTVVYDNGAAFAKTSTTGGDTFGAAVRISGIQATEPADMRTGGLPSAAVDPVTGYLYASWQDARFRGDGLNDIVLSRSTDGGTTWSAVAKVTPGVSGDLIDRFTPDVAAHGHVVTVTYRLRFNRSVQTKRFVREGFVVSNDDGLGFGPETRIMPASDNNFAARASGLIFYGDYMGIAAAPGRAHPIWNRARRAPDHPAGPHQTSWSATILTP